MNRKKRKIIALAGLMSSGFGIVGAIPSFLQERIVLAVASTFLIVGGLILIALAVGD